MGRHISKAKFITEEPGWMKNLPGNSLLNSRDMVQLFEIANKSSGIYTCIRNGSIPPASVRMPINKEFSRGRSAKLQWNIADLRKFFKANKELDDRDT